MAYVVVEFEENVDDDERGGVAAVHSSWLTPRKREVFWPPYKEQSRFDRALKNGEAVDPDNGWIIYKLSRIFYESGEYITN